MRPMASGSKAWLRTAYICAALLVVPIVGFVVILMSPGASSAESDEAESPVAGESSARAPSGADKPQVPPKVRRCCLSLARQGRSAKIEWRPAYAEAAKACNEAARGDDPSSALSTVASSLGGQSVPVPQDCQ